MNGAHSSTQKDKIYLFGCAGSTFIKKRVNFISFFWFGFVFYWRKGLWAQRANQTKQTKRKGKTAEEKKPISLHSILFNEWRKWSWDWLFLFPARRHSFNSKIFWLNEGRGRQGSRNLKIFDFQWRGPSGATNSSFSSHQWKQRHLLYWRKRRELLRSSTQWNEISLVLLKLLL